MRALYSRHKIEGFDVTTFSGHNEPECSPLSCNALATDISVNQHCLFNTFAEAKAAIERGFFKNSEPGPYRIFAVYTILQGKHRVSGVEEVDVDGNKHECGRY